MKRRSRKGLRPRILVITATFLAVIIVSFIILDKTVYPAVMELGEIVMKNRCMQIINDASDEAVAELGPAEMMSFERDNDGKIVMITANSEYLNELNGLMVEKSLQKLKEEMPAVEVPLGTAMGWTIFADSGPKLAIKTVSVGVAQADYESEVESAGINQVRFRMIILISIEMRMALGWKTKTVLVDNQQLVHESIYMGEVPNSWFGYGNIKGSE